MGDLKDREGTARKEIVGPERKGGSEESGKGRQGSVDEG